jgi:hypothetical protein
MTITGSQNTVCFRHGWGRTGHIGVELCVKVPPRCNRIYPKDTGTNVIVGDAALKVTGTSGGRRLAALQCLAEAFAFIGAGGYDDAVADHRMCTKYRARLDHGIIADDGVFNLTTRLYDYAIHHQAST